MYFAMTMFAFEGIPVILPLENQMREPQAMGRPFGVLNVGISIVFVVHLIMGIGGCWKFWDSQLSGSITLDLPQDEW